MSQIVIKDLDTKASLNSVEMSATRGGAPREESGKYFSSVNSKAVFATDGKGNGFIFFGIGGKEDEVDLGFMAMNTANMGIIKGSN